MASMFRTSQNPTRLYGDRQSRIDLKPPQAPLSLMSPSNIPMSTSSPVKASPTQAFVKPTKQAVAANRPSAVSSNNRSQSTAAVPTQRSSDSKPQKANFKTRSPNLMSSPETEGPLIFFPGSSSSGGCPTHHRHSIGDGSGLYFSSFNSFISNRVVCETCGMTFCHDLDSIVEGDQELQGDVQDLLDKDSTSDQAEELALRVEFSHLYFHLARLQVQYAMGIFVNRLREMEILEVTAHRVADEKPGVAEAYKALAPELREALYQNIEKAAEELLVKDFALLTIYDADLASVKSEAAFSCME
ncbi:hypothetical protein BKA70DRAFT_1426101 [Coprinopsis sp. MPI-PUGE-AT-0042]|nr:hypothetical protein BKA70DRAFT_1426101 [Coprinopsis sp. MPI-PUGE-AT-0042]